MSKQITSLDKALGEVVLEAYRRGFSTKSDYCREHTDYVAMAASLGLITTKVYGNVFSREWRPTVKGLMFCEKTFSKTYHRIEADDLGVGRLELRQES